MQTSALAVDKGGIEVGPNVLSGVSLPAAVVHEAPLTHNVEWMQRFAEAHGARLAPHGKTTMTPALFHRQLQAGAWGITLATATVSCRFCPWRYPAADGEPTGRPCQYGHHREPD